MRVAVAGTRYRTPCSFCCTSCWLPARSSAWLPLRGTAPAAGRSGAARAAAAMAARWSPSHVLKVPERLEAVMSRDVT